MGMPDRARHKALLFWLSLYAVFIVWASLSHRSAWTALPGDPFVFLQAPFPTWVTRTDLATNFLVYVPLGYLLRLAFNLPRHPWLTVFLAMLSVGALSVGMETLQQALPDRNASNLDVLVNALGGLSGAIVSLHHGRWRRALRYLKGLRDRWLIPGHAASFGISLFALWIIAQFSLRPVTGIGWLHLYLRPIDSQQSSLYDLNLDWFAAQGLELLALGAFVTSLLRPGRYTAGLAIVFIAAFLGKLLAAAILLKLTAVAGLLSLETLGAFFVAFWILLAPLSSRYRRGLAIVYLLAIIVWRMAVGAALLWPKAYLLNLVGLAATLAAWWPWLALAVLAALGRRHSRSR